MDTEFHYWITGLIAHRAGFTEEEAFTIAYSSEYVDENDVSLSVVNKQDGGVYSNFVSQTMNILKPKKELLRIYPIFHFVPGEPDSPTARRRDGKMHLLTTTPNSENANAILDAALCSPEETRLYRIGIASHAYVDTWAHQNFVGWYDYFNNIGLDPKPDIGHSDAEHHPDWVSHIWVDNRLVDSEVSNRTRFLSAAKELFYKYCDYLANRENRLDNSSEWESLEDELVLVMGRSYTGNRIRYEDERIESYKKRLPGFPDFDERLWLDKAIETKVRGTTDSQDGLLAKFTLFQDQYFWRDGTNMRETEWYIFQEAVKAHERMAIKLLTPTFRKMGYDLAIV